MAALICILGIAQRGQSGIIQILKEHVSKQQNKLR